MQAKRFLWGDASVLSSDVLGHGKSSFLVRVDYADLVPH